MMLTPKHKKPTTEKHRKNKEMETPKVEAKIYTQQNKCNQKMVQPQKIKAKGKMLQIATKKKQVLDYANLLPKMCFWPLEDVWSVYCYLY